MAVARRGTAAVTEMPVEGSAGRLVQLDALRGVAAMAVVLYHLSTRYNELFAPAVPASWSLPDGHLGVNLFFIISGFVIFMTIERTRRPMDFVVSRFSRLFPAYWCAIVVTFVVTQAMALPIKTVTAAEAAGNLLMLHGYLGIPHVDGVYWTLEVELMFYIGMYALWRSGRLHRIVPALAALLLLRLAYVGLQWGYGIELPWTLSRLLILAYLPWFCLGICVYRLVQAPQGAGRGPWHGLACAALVTVGLTEGAAMAALATVLAMLVWGAATGRLTWLGHRGLVALGAISYPLYLLHENIGWCVILRLVERGVPIDMATLAAVAVALLLATALHKAVEQPALRAIRRAYRARADEVREVSSPR